MAAPSGPASADPAPPGADPPGADATPERPWGRWPAIDVAPLPWRAGRAVDLAGLVLVAVLGAGLRVVQRSPLWLDEALSANIAALPLGDIPSALKRDGHPPLYYVLLHGWQEVAGDGDVAVRLLSAVIGLALIPLAFVAAGRVGGRRAAWAAALVVTLNPYVLRYATEARMYEMVAVLALAGWLVADHALRKPTFGRLGLLALLTGALLWTHYWGIWLTAASGIGLLARAGFAWLQHDRERVRDSLLVAGALVAGTLLFLPWVPTLLYQSSHTGTPWAQPSIPTEVAATSLIDLAGGGAGESILLAMAMALALALGLMAAPGRGARVEIDLRTRPEVRRMGLVIVGTLVVAVGFSYAADAAYATRYFAVVAPLVLVLVGVGLSRIGGPVAFRIALAALLVLGTVSAVRTAVSRPRTQARQAAEAIVAADGADGAAEPLVLVCPDQLGPALGRELPDDVEVLTYPDFAGPELVDWVDYEERLAEADPAAFADEAVARAGDRPVWLVWSGAYSTHEGTCEALANELQRLRPGGAPVVLADSAAYEPSNSFLYPKPG